MDRHLREDVKSDCQFSIEIEGVRKCCIFGWNKMCCLRDDRSRILGILCMFMVDRFYGRAIRDVRRITEPKGKWTKDFLNQYQMRLTKEQEINNPEAFVRTQLARGKTLGIGIQKVEAGNRLQCGSVLPLILTAVYGTYRYEQAQLLRYSMY